MHRLSQPNYRKQIQTTVEIEFSYAGFWKRVSALFLDSIVIFFINLIIGLFLGFQHFINLYTFESTDTGDIMFIIIGLLINCLYFVGMHTSNHQATLGKMALGIIVVDKKGKRITCGTSLLRFFAKNIVTSLTFVFFGFGYFMAGWTRKKQALHDMMADTLVINKS